MKYIKLLVLFNVLLLIQNIFSRSAHRPLDPQIGSISVKFEGCADTYHLHDSHLREFPLFKTYNHDYLLTKQMPTKIQSRYNANKYTEKENLEKIIDNLFHEIIDNFF